MPELPEVETVKRGLEPYLIDQTIDRLVLRRKNLRNPFPKSFVKMVAGAKVQRLRRRAKYILIDLDNDHVILSHLGMSGSFRVLNKGIKFTPEAHDHVVFEMKNGSKLIYNDPRRFGVMDVFKKDDEDAHPSLHALGIEPLSNALNGPALYTLLKGKNTPIKTALLDQKLVAGIGNIYACEALFIAGIDPRRAAGSISAQKCEKLAASIRTVLMDAIASGGSTLRDHKRIDGSEGYFQHNFAVYGRKGEVCAQCILKNGATIQAIKQAGRTSFFCGSCQR